MFTKHTYFILTCLGILLITLSIGTFFVKEGYDDYLNKLLAERGYQLGAPQLPGSSGYALQAKYTCPDGTNRLDHIDVDCSKPMRVVTVSQPGAAESCTVKTIEGESVDSCKSISNSLFCDTSIDKCNTLNTKEIAAGQLCKYNNECLSRTCVSGKCGAVVSTTTSTSSSTPLQTLGTTTGSGSGAGITNLDDYFALLNKQYGGGITNPQALDQYFAQNNLLGLPSEITSSTTTADSKASASASTTEDVKTATTATTGATSTGSETISPSKNTTQMGVATRGKDFYNKVKDLMVSDIDSVLRVAKSKAEKKELEACLDSCC